MYPDDDIAEDETPEMIERNTIIEKRKSVKGKFKRGVSMVGSR